MADALSRNVPVAGVSQISNFSLSELRTAQREDSLWSRVIYALESGDDSALPKLNVPFDQFSLRDDVLCRIVTIAKDVVTQLVVPVAFVDVVLQLLHDAPSSGHPGRDRTLAAARSKYYWPTVRIDIEKHVSRCSPAPKRKVLLPRLPF